MPDFSLVLVHNPFCQALEDFERIAEIVRREAPDIEPFIVGNDSIAAVARKQAARRPSFIFSPGQLRVQVARAKRGRYLARPVVL